MAKVKYPKKFRQKLERIAAACDTRARAGEPDLDPAFDTLWQEFIPKGSVEAIWGRMDEHRPRMWMEYHMALPERRVVFDQPPWRIETLGLKSQATCISDLCPPLTDD